MPEDAFDGVRSVRASTAVSTARVPPFLRFDALSPGRGQCWNREERHGRPPTTTGRRAGAELANHMFWPAEGNGHIIDGTRDFNQSLHMTTSATPLITRVPARFSPPGAGVTMPSLGYLFSLQPWISEQKIVRRPSV